MNSNTKKITVLFPYPKLHPFIKDDIDTLTLKYNVITRAFNSSKGFAVIIEFIKSFLFTLRHIAKVDVVYSFFPDYHCFFPFLFGKLLGKKVILITGGYESVYIPTIEYGAIAKNTIHGKVCRFLIRNADYIMAVDESLLSGINTYADPSGQGFKIGINNFIPNISSKTKTLATGFDKDFWNNPHALKTKTVVTVGNAIDIKTFKRKGFDFTLQIAFAMPEVEFHFIGLKTEFLIQNNIDIPSNAVFLDYVPYTSLAFEMSKHKVFVQLSLSEGLPSSLCEAMLCECIPVGSDVNGIPRAIGDTGYVLKRPSVEQAIDLIQLALDDENDLGKKARSRIIEHFNVEKRRKVIYQLIDESKF